MASYGGIDFFVVAEASNNQITFKDWDYGDSDAVSRTKIPYSNVSYSQQVGRSNPLLTLKVDIYSDADYNTLLTLRGDNIPRTLVDPFGIGVGYAGVLLQRVFDAERVTFAEEWHLSLQFERVV